MGNSESKRHYRPIVDAVKTKGSKWSNFQQGQGQMSDIKARALGMHAEHRREILTPIEDRFPPQAYDLKIKSFSGVRKRGQALKIVTID